MRVSSQHIIGFAAGVGTAAMGFYLYKKNQCKIDNFLRSHGIKIADSGAKNYDNLTLEELVTEKEKLEDLIAEREMAGQEEEA